jgi:hypothetical protein
LLLLTVKLPAQWVQRSVYADSVLGWVKVYHYKGAKKPLQADHRNYSIKQLSICDSFINWMQASYTPAGALGDAKKAVNTKMSLYNQNTKSTPLSYGAYSKIYLDMKRGPDGKLIIYDNTGYSWAIMANGQIGDELQLISTPEQYYFYIPAFGEPDALNEFTIRAKKNFDLSQHPAIKKYIGYFLPSGINMWHKMVVILSKNNELPYVQITKGEYIDQMSAAVDRKYTKEKEYAIKSWPEGNARSEALKRAEELYQKRLTILKNQKAKYKDRLQEKASIFTPQPTAHIEQYVDLFEGNDALNALKIPVYKYLPEKLEACKKDRPQWIAMSWPMTPYYDQERSKNKYEYAALKVMHEAILQHFNFDYLYQFFFEPEKVKGKPYRPVKIYNRPVSSGKT